jgi:hypothetical protein
VAGSCRQSRLLPGIRPTPVKVTMPQELHYRLIKSDVATAEGLLKKAIELDPQFAGAYFGLADVYVTQAWHGW